MRELTRKELSALKPGTLIQIEGYPDIFRGLAIFEGYQDGDGEIACCPIGDYDGEMFGESTTVALLEDDDVLLPSAKEIGALRSILKLSEIIAQEGGAS
ncbi:hypothetical protein [Sagittula sp.]|uniref:hypothetical protein n=1 Tax=Sagittula sp. TaxID=2038081 RepID=UPI0035155E3C